MFYYIDNIRTKLSFFRLPHNKDTALIRPIIDFFLALGRGGYQKAGYILKDIEELTHYIDHAVSGGDSIEQKMQAEREHAPESEGRYNSSVSSPADLA